jgi:hypothetical protein
MTCCLIDTNVLITANKALIPDEVSVAYPQMVLACIKTLKRITKEKTFVVLDSGGEIFNEYKEHLSFSGQPGLGDKFFKWLHDNRWRFPESARVELHKEGEDFVEFPEGMRNINVDQSDKKFFAVSNGHAAMRKPPIYEASDALWWRWKEAAHQCGIQIVFMDEQYMRDKNPGEEVNPCLP